MDYPRYCIVFDRAAKAVERADGGVEILAYDPATDEFVPAMELARHLYVDTDDADIVDAATFGAFVSQKRAGRR